MLTLILALKAVVEVAAMAVLGRSLLGLLVAQRRDTNLAYQLLHAVASPALRLARLLSPRIVIDRHLPLVALLLLGFAWIAVTGWKISHCRAIGVAACL
jgi:uncharacterized protein YggT (Ycf19 family)